MKTEEFITLDNIGFPNYKVNIKGDLMHFNKRKLTWEPIKGFKKGIYHFYHLCYYKTKKDKLISRARLIMSAFCPVSNMDELVVDHIDRDPTNDNINNLRWATYSLNSINRSLPKKYRMSKGIYVIKENGEALYFETIKNCPYKFASMGLIAKSESHYSKRHKLWVYTKDNIPSALKNVIHLKNALF